MRYVPSLSAHICCTSYGIVVISQSRPHWKLSEEWFPRGKWSTPSTMCRLACVKDTIHIVCILIQTNCSGKTSSATSALKQHPSLVHSIIVSVQLDGKTHHIFTKVKFHREVEFVQMLHEAVNVDSTWLLGFKTICFAFRFTAVKGYIHF